MGGSRGGTGGTDPPEKSQKIGFLCNTRPDPLKNHKATKPAFTVGTSSARQRNAIPMAFRWRADMAKLKRYLDPLSPYQLKKTPKYVIKIGPPLTKLSGSAHETHSSKRYSCCQTLLIRCHSVPISMFLLH